MKKVYPDTELGSNGGRMTVESLYNELGDLVRQGKGGLSVEVTGNACFGAPYLCEVSAEVTVPLEKLSPRNWGELNALNFATRLKRGAVHLSNEAGLSGIEKINALLAVMDRRLKAGMSFNREATVS